MLTLRVLHKTARERERKTESEGRRLFEKRLSLSYTTFAVCN